MTILQVPEQLSVELGCTTWFVMFSKKPRRTQKTQRKRRDDAVTFGKNKIAAGGFEPPTSRL